MKVLVIGGGGREHALAWKLAQSPKVQRVWVAPGNGGTALDQRLVNLPISDVGQLRDWALAEKIDLTVVGPEAPLAAGVVDLFRAAGLRIFGPSQAAAQLESSKAFSKAFMKRHGVPTAAYETFSDPAQAHAYVDRMGAPIVIKADGLAAGKGVVVAMSLAEAHEAIDFMLVGNTPAAEKVQVQVVLIPSATATGIPDYLASRYLEALAEGAKSELMLTPDTTFFNPELAALQAQVQQSEAQLRAAQGSRWPGIELRYSQMRDPEVRQGHLSVGIQVPLLDTRSGPVAQASAELQRAQVRLEGRQAELQQQILVVWKSLEIARLRIEALSQGSVREAEAALRVAQAAYRFGERGILDVLDAQRVLRSVRADLIDARFQLQVARIALDQLTGQHTEQTPS